MNRWVWICGLASLLSHAACADNFASVYYDKKADQLVVTMTYSGTNPNHKFSLKWGQCVNDQPGNPPEVAVEILDDQWQDEAQSDFKKTTRFSLAGIPCRPASVTLRSAPRFIYTLVIP